MEKRTKSATVTPKSARSHVRLLFIGNSFTNRNDLPRMLERIAASAKPPRMLHTERVIENGMSLMTHWNHDRARSAIAGSGWDYVVLQEQSTLPLKNPQKMHDSIRLFDTDIRAHGAKTVLYLTWARRHDWQRQAELSDAYLRIAEALGSNVVPVGIAWQRVLAAHPDLVLHDKDNSHPSPAGSYLAACVFFATLFETKSLTAKTIASESLDPELAMTLRDLAVETVKDFKSKSKKG